MKELIWIRLLDAIVVSLADRSVAMAAAPEMRAKSTRGGSCLNSHPFVLFAGREYHCIVIYINWLVLEVYEPSAFKCRLL